MIFYLYFIFDRGLDEVIKIEVDNNYACIFLYFVYR